MRNMKQSRIREGNPSCGLWKRWVWSLELITETVCIVCCMCFYYSEEKAKLLRRITTKIEEKNQKLRFVSRLI